MAAQSRLRALRRLKGITIGALAAQVGINKGHLSRIERGEKTPSLGTLMALAKALGAEMAELFGEKISDRDFTIVRAADRARLPGDQEYGIEGILPADPHLPLSLYLVAPGRDFLAHDLPNHDGFETLFVVKGIVELRLASHLIELSPGDCIAYDANISHQLKTVSEEPASVLVMLCKYV